MNRLARIAPAVLIAAAPMVMLYPLWANPICAGEDDVVHYYPARKMVGDAIASFRLPVRNPHEATGAPLMGDPQSAVMYPPTWLFAAIDAKLAYSISIFMAFSLAGVGAYLYLRGLSANQAASAFSAVTFMFCGFMVAHRVHLSLIHTAAYLPWGLWWTERFARRSGQDRAAGPGALAVLAIIVYLSLTAGHWPTLVHVLVVWFVYLLVRARPVGRAILCAFGAVVLAMVLAAPQLAATIELMQQVTRRRIGLITAGENSFFAPAGVLAFFPMLMGSRHTNFFAQQWWGPWHLCEMLGYVGLAALPLAGAAWWRLRRSRGDHPAAPPGHRPLRPVVRLWGWLAIAAAIWMLGYYFPPFWFIQKLPVLGVIRCPARMVLVLDLALAVLAGIGINAMCDRGVGVSAALGRTIRRAVTIVLPAAMAASLAGLWIAALVMPDTWAGRIPFPMTGGARDVLQAVSPANPAVWVQAIILAATIAVVLLWLAGPQRRAWLLVAVALGDLFFITRFVDVPADYASTTPPELSPAAAWLAENAPDRPYRVWGLSDSYHRRAGQLLGPKTAHAMGISTINSYGPFQSPAHAHLLGFRIFGTAANWRWLVHENRLLSLYNVRYLLAADRKFRDAIESVQCTVNGRIVAERFGRRNLLTGRWSPRDAEVRGERLIFETAWFWQIARAEQNVPITARRYRISLEARTAADSTAGILKAEIAPGSSEWIDWEDNASALIIHPEQIGAGWRRFEWVFDVPPSDGRDAISSVSWVGQGRVEVRRLALHAAEPQVAAGTSKSVYKKVAELPALDAAGRPVAIYENTLCDRGKTAREIAAGTDVAEIERFKWDADDWSQRIDISIQPGRGPGPETWFKTLTLPGIGLLIAISLIATVRVRRNG